MIDERSLRQYDSSLTQLVESDNDYIIKYLKNIIKKEAYSDLIEYLNSEESLITPAYILKRQVQEFYSDCLADAAAQLGIEVADLTKTSYTYWTDSEADENCLITALTKTLKKRVWTDTKTKWSSFESYFLGKIPLKRKTILMLATAFQMDDITLTKFLFSCSKHELSVRNPIDYIYLYCRQNKEEGKVLQWTQVENLLQRYEEGLTANNEIQRPASAESQGNNEELPGTYLLQRSLFKSSENKDSSSSNYANIDEDSLLEFMWQHQDLFTSILYRERENSKGQRVVSKTGQYQDGYSRTRKASLYELARILVKIYPSCRFYKSNNSNGIYREEKVSTDENGYPNLSQLVKIMTHIHGWDFSTGHFIDDESQIKIYTHKDGQIGIPRSQKKIIFDSIPFRKYVYLYCKGFNAKIRMINNIGTDSKIIESVERQDVLYLGYMFISGFNMMTENQQEDLCDLIDESYGDIPAVQSFIHIMELLMDSDDDRVLETYQSCLNLLLSVFDFGELYLPFVFDRFVLLALLGEKESQDITWTSPLMEEGYWGDINELENA